MTPAKLGARYRLITKSKLGLVLFVFASLHAVMVRGNSLWSSQLSNLGHVHLTKYLVSTESGELSKEALAVAARYLTNAYLRAPNDSRLPWRLGYALFHLEKYQTAADFLSQARSQNRPEFLLTRQSGEYHILRAILAEESQNWSLALQEYRLALALAPRRWDQTLYQRYYSTLAHSPDPKVQQVARRILGYLKGLAVSESVDMLPENWAVTLSPFYSIDDSSYGCWVLLGVKYDREALEQGPLVPIQFLWQKKAGSEQRVQSLLAANLAPNAGLEWGMVDGQPVGYPHTIYFEDLQIHQLIQTVSVPGRISTVAMLANSPAYINSSYASMPVTVDADRVYFQGGWMKSEDSHAYLSHALHGAKLEVSWPWQHAYSIFDKDWMFYGRAMSLPPYTDQVELWLLNFNSEGRAYFDDLMFFTVAPPACQ